MFRGKHAGLLALVIAGAVSGQAHAWGPEGHAIVAEIAEARLTPAASTQVVQLLALESHQHLDQIASWADDYRETHPETGPWHFVNIPLSAATYDANRDCAGGNCVVAQLQHFAQILADRSAAPADRLTALKFVVHFVGDIHQPLHCEDDFSTFPPPEGDKGGNKITLTYNHKSTNLHAVWDGGVIEQALGVRLGPHFAPDLTATAAEALTLNQQISGATAATWAPDGLAAHLDTATIEWANGAHALAKTAYAELPTVPRPRGWDQTYQGEAWPVIQDQLARGGVRLAELLNEELR